VLGQAAGAGGVVVAEAGSGGSQVLLTVGGVGSTPTGRNFLLAIAGPAAGMVLEVISVMRRTRGAVVVVKEERNAEVGQRKAGSSTAFMLPAFSTLQCITEHCAVALTISVGMLNPA